MKNFNNKFSLPKENVPTDIIDEINEVTYQNKRKHEKVIDKSIDNSILHKEYKLPNIDIFKYSNFAEPNDDTVRIYDLLDTFEFINYKSLVCLGKDADNKAVYCDILKAPHILISGPTGSGKSICIHSIITSMLCKATPDEVKFLIIDPRQVEYLEYAGIPHLLVPVVTDSRKAVGALSWAISEMLLRYKKMSQAGARDIDSYNKYADNYKNIEPLPEVYIFIDGLEIIMLDNKTEVEKSICQMTQMGRAAGIHLIIATQQERIIKKADFNVFIKAEILTNECHYDTYYLLYKNTHTKEQSKLKGCFVSINEIKTLCDFIKNQTDHHYIDKIAMDIEATILGDKKSSPFEHEDDYELLDPLFNKAVDVILKEGKVSTSFIQRKLSLNYARSAKIIDQLQEKGLIGPANGSNPREILISRNQWISMQKQQQEF